MCVTREGRGNRGLWHYNCTQLRDPERWSWKTGSDAVVHTLSRTAVCSSSSRLPPPVSGTHEEWQRHKYCINTHCMGLLSGERFGFHTAVLALLHVELPPSMPDRHFPFSTVSVMLLCYAVVSSVSFLWCHCIISKNCSNTRSGNEHRTLVCPPHLLGQLAQVGSI